MIPTGASAHAWLDMMNGRDKRFIIAVTLLRMNRLVTNGCGPGCSIDGLVRFQFATQQAPNEVPVPSVAPVPSDLPFFCNSRLNRSASFDDRCV